MAKTYRRILIATDFSPGSRAALRHLEAVCGIGGGRQVHLAHVLEPLPFIVPPAPVIGFEEARRHGARRALARVGARVARRLGRRATVAVHLLEGAPAAEICRCAAAVHADLVVVGTHGRTGVGHLLIGSVAERVVRHAPCPVLTVPVRAPRRKRPAPRA